MKSLLERTTLKGISAALLVAILPMAFGSLLFAALVKDFESDTEFRRLLVTEAYIPMREVQYECHQVQNSLVIQRQKLAGVFQLNIDELLAVHDKKEFRKAGQQSVIFMEASMKVLADTNAELEVINKNFSDCSNKRFRAFEAMALMTGNYERFHELSEARADNVNAIYEKRRQRLHEIVGETNMQDIWVAFREEVVSRGQSDTSIVKQLRDIGPQMFEAYIVLAETEQEIFDSDRMFYEELQVLFATDISNRFEESFLSRLF